MKHPQKADLDLAVLTVPAVDIERLADLIAERLRDAVAAPAPTPELMDTPTAARYLQRSAHWLSLMRMRGGGPPYSKVGRFVRYRKADCDAWLASTGTKQAA